MHTEANVDAVRHLQIADMTLGLSQDSKSDGSLSPQASPKPRIFKVRDPRWLQVQVCHEFLTGRCSRCDSECNFAHPPENCQIENGKVTACFDAMKGRCQRESCKYFHPPKQIKAHLEALGRTFQQQRLFSLQRQQSMPCSGVTHMENPFPAINQNQWGGRWCSAENLGTEPSSPRSPTLPRRLDKSDKLEICSDFVNHCCPHGEQSCPFAHLPASITPDPDGYVTVCMDFMKGECQRVSCRYFHPPPHLQARVRAAQRRPSQISAPVVPTPPQLPQQQVVFISPVPFPGQQIQVPAQAALPPLVPSSPDMMIPVTGYPDGSCMMSFPVQAVPTCYWPSGEAVMFPCAGECFHPIPNQIMGQYFEMMTPPATP